MDLKISMKKTALVVTAVLAAAFSLQAGSVDRGLGSPRSEYIPKGSFQFGLLGGFNKYNSGGLNGSQGATFLGLVTNISGQVSSANLSLSGAYFAARNMSVGTRFTYDNTGIDCDSANLMSTLQFENQHINMESFTGALTYRAYLPLFNSKVFALFGEARLNGRIGYTKNYQQEARGKVGTYADVYSVSLGLYPGMNFFVTDNVAVEISLPLLEGGYEWNHQISGGEREGAQSHGFITFQPGILWLNLGITVSF